MTDVSYSGPVFDGRAAAMTDEMVRDIRTTVGDHAFVAWESNMEASIRHSGPVYQSFAQVKDAGGDTVVNDGYDDTNQLEYGPWLEGIGSRNSPVTKFPGYHSMKRAFEEVEPQVDALAEPIVDDYVERINNE